MRAALAALALLAGCAPGIHAARDTPASIPPPTTVAEWRLTWRF